MESHNVLDCLKQINIEIRDIITVDEKAIYIHGLTSYGDELLIDLDVVDNIPKDDISILSTTKTDNTVIQDSLLNGEMAKYNNALSGIAIVCDDTMCVLQRTNTSISEPFTYKFEENKSIINDKIPIVKYSLLIEFPNKVIESIRKSSMFLIRERRNKELRTMKDIEQYLKFAYDSAKALIDDTLEINKSLDEDFESLNKYHDEAMDEVKTGELYKNLIYNISHRKNYEIDRYKTLGQMDEYLEDLRKIAMAIESKRVFLKREAPIRDIVYTS